MITFNDTQARLFFTGQLLSDEGSSYHDGLHLQRTSNVGPWTFPQKLLRQFMEKILNKASRCSTDLFNCGSPLVFRCNIISELLPSSGAGRTWGLARPEFYYILCAPFWGSLPVFQFCAELVSRHISRTSTFRGIHPMGTRSGLVPLLPRRSCSRTSLTSEVRGPLEMAARCRVSRQLGMGEN